MDKIIPSFQKSLFDSSKEIIGDLLEVGIDSVLDDGLFRDLPVVGLLVGIKKTAQNLHDRNLLRQTLQFIKEFNDGTIDIDKLEKYKQSICDNTYKAEEELGRVLLYLNSNIELEKSKMLANLFKNYILEVISWDEFCEFSEIIKMMLIGDINYLKIIYNGKVKDTVGYPLYPFDRLVSLGLINTTPKGLRLIDPDGSYVRYDKFVSMSKIGGKFYETTAKKWLLSCIDSFCWICIILDINMQFKSFRKLQ